MSVELAGLALAIPPTIDLCLKYGRELKALCTALKHADAEISERVLRLDHSWLRWSHQLNFLQRVQHLMDEDHREVYDQTLHVFLGKLEIVTVMLKSLVRWEPDNQTGGSYRPRQIKYALIKNKLDKAIEELEIWQKTADHSWFLLMKIASPQVDLAIAGDNAGMAGHRAIPALQVSPLGLTSWPR